MPVHCVSFIIAGVECGVLCTLYNIFGRFDFNIVVEEVVEVLTFKLVPPLLLLIVLLLSDVLNNDVIVVIYVLEHHLFILHVFIKYGLFFLFVEVVVEGDNLGPILPLPLLLLLHLVPHADLAGPGAEALVFFVDV